jgi:YVTN family beta-propeller protein
MRRSPPCIGLATGVVAYYIVGYGIYFIIAVIVITNIIHDCQRGSRSSDKATVLATISMGKGLFSSVGKGSFGISTNTILNSFYVLNRQENRISVLDGKSNKIIATVSVGRSPELIATNPTTNRVFVCNDDENTVSVLDGISNTIIATINVGKSPEGIDINQTSNQVYVTNKLGNTVSVLDGVIIQPSPLFQWVSVQVA